ncbi:MAG: hypothetical protein NC305_19325 [Lachnospiraceae bacterium]|nr:hypothetical protein [Lachnospiraceae bacterium]
MAFCEKCGKELRPDGTCDCQQTQGQAASAGQAAYQEQIAYQGQAAYQGQTAYQGQNAASQGQPAVAQKLTEALKNKKLLAIVGGVAAALVLLIVIIAVVAGSGSYKTPVKDLVKLINKQSTDAFAYLDTVQDPVSMDYLKAAYKLLKKSEEVKEEFEDNKEDLKDYYADYKGFKITSCDFVKATKIKSKELRSIEDSYFGFDKDDYEDLVDEADGLDKGDYEDLAESMDISVSNAKKFVKETLKYFKAVSKAKVKDGYEVTVRFYGKYQGDSDKTEKIEDIRIIKVNGTWYILDASRLFRALSFTDDLSDIDMYELYDYITDIGGVPSVSF